MSTQDAHLRTITLLPNVHNSGGLHAVSGATEATNTGKLNNVACWISPLLA